MASAKAGGTEEQRSGCPSGEGAAARGPGPSGQGSAASGREGKKSGPQFRFGDNVATQWLAGITVTASAVLPPSSTQRSPPSAVVCVESP